MNVRDEVDERCSVASKLRQAWLLLDVAVAGGQLVEALQVERLRHLPREALATKVAVAAGRLVDWLT